MKDHTKKIIIELCSYLGEDLDQPMCMELWEHVQKCPQCQEYIHSVKTTIEIIRDIHEPRKAPAEVKERILKILNLK